MQELIMSLRKETNFICMITEPSLIRHRQSGIPRHYNSIPTTKDNSPRAAIFTSSSIPIQDISNLSHRDLAVPRTYKMWEQTDSCHICLYGHKKQTNH